MKATYIGEEIAVSLFGLIFPRGQAVEVTDEHAAKKLANNPQFQVVAAAEPKSKGDGKAKELKA